MKAMLQLSRGESECVTIGITMTFGNTALSVAIQMSHRLFLIYNLYCLLSALCYGIL
jgi:hypothetical protein